MECARPRGRPSFLATIWPENDQIHGSGQRKQNKQSEAKIGHMTIDLHGGAANCTRIAGKCDLLKLINSEFQSEASSRDGTYFLRFCPFFWTCKVLKTNYLEGLRNMHEVPNWSAMSNKGAFVLSTHT